eukprot:3092561-Lingulodinium_polyedra.AAC.1
MQASGGPLVRAIVGDGDVGWLEAGGRLGAQANPFLDRGPAAPVALFGEALALGVGVSLQVDPTLFVKRVGGRRRYSSFGRQRA